MLLNYRIYQCSPSFCFNNRGCSDLIDTCVVFLVCTVHSFLSIVFSFNCIVYRHFIFNFVQITIHGAPLPLNTSSWPLTEKPLFKLPASQALWWLISFCYSPSPIYLPWKLQFNFKTTNYELSISLIIELEALATFFFFILMSQNLKLSFSQCLATQQITFYSTTLFPALEIDTWFCRLS